MTELETVAGVVALGAEWIRLGLEALGATVIGVGAIVTLRQLARDVFQSGRWNFTAARLLLAQYLALALEFQLAADVLETAIAPEWPKLAQLAAVATIRTALNYFLGREMREERELVERPRPSTPSAAVTGR